MRKTAIFLIIFCMLGSFGFAEQHFTKKASGHPEIIQTGKAKNWCPICGMNLKMFYKTNHAVVLKNKKNRQYCSMRCLAVDYPNIKNKIDKILVVDAKSEKLINAYKAHYVVGSKILGTMSKTSKFAFKSEKDAKEFQQKYGGELMNFDNAFKSAQNSLKDDNEMLMKKKEKMVYPLGKRVYEKKCKQIDPKKFKNIAGLKADIINKKLCSKMNKRQLQATALYLWEIKRTGKTVKEVKEEIKVANDEKCPVCGMFVYKYHRWATQLFFMENSKIKHLSFDGVKDLMKFYFEPEKWGNYKNIKIIKILVTDYYTQNAIRARKAFFVIGSDVLGPMGNELIPFKSKAEAEIFMKDHRGKKIVMFNQITKKMVYNLDK